MSEPFTITEVFVFIAEQDGREGVPTFMAPNGLAMPMLAADASRLDQLLRMARQIVQETGQPMKLCRFSGREEIETIAPLIFQHD